MTTRLNPKAVRKAMQAADLLAKAARLMREAAGVDGERTVARYDFLHWAIEIEQILSCDNGEAGIGPTIAKLTR